MSLRYFVLTFFFFSSRRRHTSWPRDWSSDVCSSDLNVATRRVPPAAPSRADTEATTRVFPCCTIVGLHRPVLPVPLATHVKIQPGLHRNPIGARGQHCRSAEVNDKIYIVRTRVRLVHRSVNLCSRQTARILVEKDVKGYGRPGKTVIRPLHVNLRNIPSLTPRHHKIVSGKVIKRIE